MQARVPIPRQGVDILALPLSTVEGFVLSRVDGFTSLEDISIMSGIAPAKVLTILERLCDLGAVELSWRPPRPSIGRNAPEVAQPPPSPAPPAPATRSGPAGQRRSAPARDAAPADAHFASDPARFPSEELEESSELLLETRRRILHAYYALEGRNLYQVLGVAREADRQAVRNAYFRLSKLFHPDAYFGKELGRFKPKLEAVFKRLTESYEVLGKAKKRKEYDEYLAVTEQAQKAQRTLQSFEFTEQEIDALRQAAQRNAGVARETPDMPSSEALRPPRLPQAEPPVSAAPPPSQAERRARVRERVRQRLGPFVSQRPAPPTPAPAENPEEGEQRRRSLIEGLRNSLRASAMISSPAQPQLEGLRLKAKKAEMAGDVLLAASNLQLALGIEPNNGELLAEYERVSKVVARNLADNYEKQAHYEEKTGNWQAAARSWQRVSDGRPEDAEAARSAAEALLKASGDLHVAQKYAQKAATIDPRSVVNLTALARVYLAAGLKLNALRELEKAVRLNPGDELVNNLLREAR